MIILYQWLMWTLTHPLATLFAVALGVTLWGLSFLAYLVLAEWFPTKWPAIMRAWNNYKATTVQECKQAMKESWNDAKADIRKDWLPVWEAWKHRKRDSWLQDPLPEYLKGDP